VTWITETIGCFFPEAWTAFAQTGARRTGESVIDAYYRLMLDPDRKTREHAAEAWCKWEDVVVSLDPQAKPSARFADPAFRMNFATLVIHYFANAAFLEGQEILKNMGRIARLPGVLIHGRLDVSGPLRTAWQPHQRWSESRLIVVETEGHGGSVMADEFTKAIANFVRASLHSRIKTIIAVETINFPSALTTSPWVSVGCYLFRAHQRCAPRVLPRHIPSSIEIAR
jgi:proline iminopeptidase